MLNPFRDVNWDPGPVEKRKFANSLIIGFPAVAALLSIASRLIDSTWKQFPLWLGAIGLAVGLVLRFVPSIAKAFYLVWHFAACCVGFVTGNLLLAALYYIIVTPLGLLLRALGKLSLRKGAEKTVSTYWRDAEKTVDFARYYRQY